MSKYSFGGAGMTILGVDRRVVRAVGLMLIFLLPSFFALVLIAMSSEADVPIEEEQASRFVLKGYQQIITSPLDYLVIAMVFAMTFLVGLLFFLNKKYHYVIMLFLLAIMALINFLVLMSAIQGGIEFPVSSFVGIIIVIYGFGILPTLIAFIFGGFSVIMLSFKNARLREDSFATSFNTRFTQIGGLKIWRPKLFAFSIFASIVLLLWGFFFPQIEGNAQTKVIYGFFLGIIIFWCFLLIMIQLTFNLAQNILRPGFFAFKHTRRSPFKRHKTQSSKQSIQNIRKRQI